MKKYEFTGETRILNENVTLHRIRAVVPFGNVSAGDTGGWIEDEKNLSHNGNAWVCRNARVYGNANVYGNARVCSDARVYGDAHVYGNANVYGNACVYGDAHVYGNAHACDDACVCDGAHVFSASHVLTIGPIGSRSDFTTFYRSKGKQIMVKCGCFNGTIDEFLGKVRQTHGENRHAAVYRTAAELAKLQIDLSGIGSQTEEDGED